MQVMIPRLRKGRVGTAITIATWLLRVDGPSHAGVSLFGAFWNPQVSHFSTSLWMAHTCTPGILPTPTRLVCPTWLLKGLVLPLHLCSPLSPPPSHLHSTENAFKKHHGTQVAQDLL